MSDKTVYYLFGCWNNKETINQLESVVNGINTDQDKNKFSKLIVLGDNYYGKKK